MGFKRIKLSRMSINKKPKSTIIAKENKSIFNSEKDQACKPLALSEGLLWWIIK